MSTQSNYERDRRKQMLELQIKDLETNEILVSGTVEQLAEMCADDEEDISEPDEVQSKRKVKRLLLVHITKELS